MIMQIKLGVVVVAITDLLDKLGFTMELYFLISNIIISFILGNFSYLGIRFVFVRRLSFYLTKIYIPAMLVVFVSWLSFFVDRNSAPARVSLGITTVLTMTTLIMGFGQDSLPVVSYMRALDLYLIVCYLLVFGSFAEYALVNYRSKPDNKRISEVIDAGKINIYIEWKFDIFCTVECQSLFR